MVKFNADTQTEDSSKSLPLANTFFKVRKDLKEHYFAVNEFKESKNGEWLVCNAHTAFTVLVHNKSKQYQALMTLLEHCESRSTALICRFSAETKSGVVFGEDDELLVTWEDSDDWDFRYHFDGVCQYSIIPPPPTPDTAAEKPARRARKAKPQ